MSKISQKLSHQPNDLHEFDDNGQIKALLLELNIESKFQQNLIGPSVQAVNYGEHPTHFILVVYYSGHDDSKDNGYVAWCLPKSKCSYQQFMDFSQQILEPSDDRLLKADIFWTKPGNPSN